MPDMDEGRVRFGEEDVTDRSVSSDYLERIRRRAYELWEQEGRPEGRELAHWAQAEHEIRQGQGI